MKRLRIAVTTLCLVAALAFVIPTAAYADDGGPQGTGNSAPKPPPPPPPDWLKLFYALISVL